MCGLAGVVGVASNEEARAFVDLLQISSLRGPHSTGLLIAKKGVTSILKDCENSVSFVNSKQMQQHLTPSWMFADVYMGHCRYATVGEVTSKNAHPFREGPLIVAHNGTLTSVAKRLKNITDSQWMAIRMAKDGIIPVLSSLDWLDSFAVSVYDTRDRCLYLARNNDRPLFVAVAEDTGTVFYASEADMLRFCLRRNDVDNKVYRVEPYVLMKIDPRLLTKSNKAPWTIQEIPFNEKAWNFGGGYEIPAGDAPFV